MKISNSPNVSFKAQFVVKVDPTKCSYPTEDKFVRAIDNAPIKTNNLLKFFGFLQSEEGGEILSKLPKDDVIRLETPFYVDACSGRVSVQPYLIYEPSGVTEAEKNKIYFSLPEFRAQGTFMDASRKIAPQFKKWVNDLVIARKSIE